MNGLNGIIKDGRIYVATEDNTHSCLNSCLECDLIGEWGECPCRDFCFEQGRDNIFCFSQELTDKLNTNGIQQKDT